MRLTLVVIVFGAISLSASTSRQPHTAVVAIEQPGGPPTATEPIDAKWAVTQGGFFLLILAILWSYRRDFFRKLEALEVQRQGELQRERQEKEELKQVLRDNTVATQTYALASQRNTDAINANTQATSGLAKDVRALAERRIRDRDA